MKLNKENIQFIDTYLKNSDIMFTDVRTEMVDHVATAVSEDMKAENLTFYDAFKAYMVVHKKDLLKYNKQFKKTTDKIVLKLLFKKFIAPLNICIMIASFFLLIQFFPLGEKKFLKFVPFGFLIITILVYYILVLKKRKQRFSGIERAGLMLTLIFQLYNAFQHPFFNEKSVITNDYYFSLFFALLLGLSTAFIAVILDLYKKYTNHYAIA
ncbi:MULTISPECIES: hypothetical protein [unclassified Cellulophaga]|uniref:hypothetical protein n=1 Tax=unclassified Cellulophaga TaxID=2634405 RepID=UPI0026E260E3|nr:MULTISPECIES: hypothetical protein [unclassified Cellulophaga]MDO6489782.1 hypothetical protein [Cellulophaga sp. 2_MG-2023]MDO6495024.1 hypothetical protein [Cellulophaga sp. 3_MG-2023]